MLTKEAVSSKTNNYKYTAFQNLSGLKKTFSDVISLEYFLLKFGNFNYYFK